MGAERVWPPPDLLAWLNEPKPPIPIQMARFLCDLVKVNPRDELVSVMLDGLTRFIERMADDAQFREYRAEVADFEAAYQRWLERGDDDGLHGTSAT